MFFFTDIVSLSVLALLRTFRKVVLSRVRANAQMVVSSSIGVRTDVNRPLLANTASCIYTNGFFLQLTFPTIASWIMSVVIACIVEEVMTFTLMISYRNGSHLEHFVHTIVRHTNSASITVVLIVVAYQIVSSFLRSTFYAQGFSIEYS